VEAASPSTISPATIDVDRELADIAASFSFLMDVTPIDLVDVRDEFWKSGRPPVFQYRPLQADPGVVEQRLHAVNVAGVEDPTLASLMLAKQRELLVLTEMLSCRDSADFRVLSVEEFGAVSPSLLAEAEDILDSVPPPAPDPGPWLDASTFVSLAQAELDQYRAFAPDITSKAELREESSGVMVSDGDLLVAPTAKVSARRAEALLQHEIGTHVVTYLNGAHQPLRMFASGLAGHEETQEGLAVLAEHLVGGLSARRLRQLAARVVAVHEMLAGASFPEVHRGLRDAGVPKAQAFTITMRVFRSGGLTKDAVYLRGLHELIRHLAAGGGIDVLLLGKMPLAAVPLVASLHERGVLTDPLLRPRYLDHAGAAARLDAIHQVERLASLLGGTP
jgi:uncharacterized protein (TIGR02421 family)